MSDCWVAGSGPAAAVVAVAAGGGADAADAAFGEADGSDGLKTPARPEVPWAPGGTADGVNGIEGGWMITPFIPSGRVWSNAPVPRKEWTIMVSDRILAGYPAFSALVFSIQWLSQDVIYKKKKKKTTTHGDPSGASTKINVLENDLYVPEGNSLNCPCIIKHNLT